MILARKIVSDEQIVKIIDYWRSGQFDSNKELLDSVRTYEVTLRVPLKLRGSLIFININCRLYKKKHKKGNELFLEVKNIFFIYRPFLVGFFAGTLAFIFFIPVLHSLVIGVIGSLFLGLIVNLALWISAPVLAKQFLNELIKKP